jgi:Kef-type K+ transport system membrane component KefB
MLSEFLDTARNGWEMLQDRLVFLPPFPDQLDTLALFSLMLVIGLLIGERLHTKFGCPKLIGYVLAGAFFGPSVLGWISFEALAQTRSLADAALGILMLEIGRRLDLRWLFRHRELIRTTVGDIVISFFSIFLFSLWIIGLSPAWSAAAGAVTMASAPAVVLLIVEETKAQGLVTERIILHTALSSAASFIVFAVVLGIVHAQYSEDWVNALVHPLWVAVGATAISMVIAATALGVGRIFPKRSLAQVFVLIASALLAVGVSRMLAVPVFLTLFFTGVVIAFRDDKKTLSYTSLPESHWLLAIVLFVVVGASLPLQQFTWISGLQAIGLLCVRGAAKLAVLRFMGGTLPVRKRLLVGIGIQPLSATAVFMAYGLVGLYPEIGRSALSLPLLAAAIMDVVGPLLCRYALREAGETAENRTRSQGVL